jgi:hypothetical protein
MHKLLKLFMAVCLLSIMLSSCNTGLQQPLPPKTDNPYVAELWKENHFQDKATGDRWIAKYKQLVDDTTGTIKHKHYISETFNSLAIYQLLSVKGVVGLRNHFGIDDNGDIRVLITGVDASNRLLFLKVKRTDTKQQGIPAVPSKDGEEGEEVYLEIGKHP